MLSWLHVGDLHVSHDDAYLGVERLRQIVADANRYLTHAIDFVFLPGDNANNGTPTQYAKINEVLADLALPVFALPGDHDFEPGSLDAYRAMHGARALPLSQRIGGRRCLFLDLVSAGTGGPDFRLGAKQTHWLERELQASLHDIHGPAVFMHGYPDDLQDDSAYITRLLSEAGVAVVDTGHTHYNELLNDGSVIYTSTRSTSQVEEGDGMPGYSVVSIDDDAVSWRFKPLDSSWPFVIITYPADDRLLTRRGSSKQRPLGTQVVRAKVFGEDVRQVSVCIDHGAPVPMAPVEGEPAVWSAEIATPNSNDPFIIEVQAQGIEGISATDQVTVSPLLPDRYAAAAHGTSSRVDACAVKPWPEHGVLGTQLGPNKHGRKW